MWRGFLAEIAAKNDDNQFIDLAYGIFGAGVGERSFWQMIERGKK
jgi:hypothetical protein